MTGGERPASARRRLALDATLAQLAAEGFSERQISDAMWDCARLTDPEAEREAAYAAEVLFTENRCQIMSKRYGPATVHNEDVIMEKEEGAQ